MLSANARPALRPRPPAQRRPSRQHPDQHLPHQPDSNAPTCIADDAPASHPRSAFSDIQNIPTTTTSDAVHAEHTHTALGLATKATLPDPHGTTLASQAADLRGTSTYDPDSLTSSISEDELDHLWLGGLERNELEQLLIEASRKVREREHKLVIAANIGKALLEKNLTLRSGIMTSMASSSSLFGLTDIEAMINDFAEPQDAAFMHHFSGLDTGSTHPSLRPMNTPPTTDNGVQPQCDISPRAESDTTPLAHPIPLPQNEPDYFGGPTTATTQPQKAQVLHVEASTLGFDKPVWVPSQAGLVVSQPCSPSASVSSFASNALISPLSTMSRVTSKWNPTGGRHRSRPSLLQLQALEAQRQLASLGEQNDVLHQQISELQLEAESARSEGTKKLSRLNKEIRGLKAELEAATRRNVELETNHFPARPASSSRSPLRGFVVHHQQDPSSPLLFRVADHQGSPATSCPPPSLPAVMDAPTSDHHGILPSTSNLEDMVRSAQTTAAESALVSQLLAKIKELEETNSAMAREEQDFGSRMGRAMQEEERLRDAFNTVGQDLGVETAISRSWETPEQAQRTTGLTSKLSPSDATARPPGFVTPSQSLCSLNSLASADASSPVSSLSPGHKRRAPGNRHIIEHHRTVRTAIRRAKKELAAGAWDIQTEAPQGEACMSRSSTEKSLGTYSIDLSGTSSSASSPRPRALNGKASTKSLALGPAGRPRIRITPSIEDLGCRRKMQEQVVVGPPQDSSAASEWKDVTSPIAPNFHQNASLSPLDAMQTYLARADTKTARGHAGRCRPEQSEALGLSSTTMGPSLSPSQKRFFNATARVRRSRSRSSSFGSDTRAPYQASSIHQSPDPFMDDPTAWNRFNKPRSCTSASSNRGRTLGSELGSIFGGDDCEHDFDDDLPQRRRPVASTLTSADVTKLQPLVLHSSADASALELRSKIMVGADSDRPTANVGRLVPENTEEHQDDLECVLTQSVHGHVDDVFLDDFPLHPRDAALLARVEAEERGAWLADQPIIETGGLQDEDEPRGAQFDLISKVVEHQAVAWADDDDYGRTISQREAVKLGLLPQSSSLAGRSVRLLKDKSKRGSSIFGTARSSGSQNQKQRWGTKEAASFRLEIESSEQVEHRLHIESLLRRRRQDLLRERGFADGWEQHAGDRKQEDELVATYVTTPQKLQERRRQTLSVRSNGWSPSLRDSTVSDHDSHQSTQQWVRDLAGISPTTTETGAEEQGSMSLDCGRPEDGEFELIDCPSWKKQGGRGTDYFPTSFGARYRPTMVKQRVVHVSQVTYGWVEEWIQFAFVVFLAFVVMVEQGPNRNIRRGKPNMTVPPTLLNKA